LLPRSRPRHRLMAVSERRELVRNRLIESRLTPNAISLTGFVLNVVAAVLVWQGEFVWGGIAFIVGSVCDTLDRREEGIVLTAVAVHFTKLGDEAAVAATVVAVLSSLMVSYTRARAEAL